MIVRSHKYRRLTPEKAASITVASGDTLTVSSGGTLTVASGATMTQTGGTLTSPVINTPTGTKSTEVVTATNIITAAESGKTFFLSSATEFASTLPAVAAGLVFDFYVSAAPSGASYTIAAASGTPIVGHVVTTDVNSVTDPGFTATGVLTITFVDAKAVKGDRVHLECDGTNWYATAFCSVFDAITFS